MCCTYGLNSAYFSKVIIIFIFYKKGFVLNCKLAIIFMLSILIPTYNYSVVNLVRQLHKQAKESSIPFEIIVVDDCSTDIAIFDKNKKIKELEFCAFLKNNENIGRTATRNLLANKAKFNQLLFLDADVYPKSDSFIKLFLSNMDSSEIIFGGISYKNEEPPKEEILRWKYGKSRESLTVKQRIKNPYRTINSGCFLINKPLFLKINKELDMQKYGMDIYFKQLLHKYQSKVNHIDNPVYHLGLETSKVFIKKSLEAIETICYLEKNHQLNNSLIPLQKFYQKLSILKIDTFYLFILNKLKIKIENNLNSSRPNLVLFDLYRLNYYIEFKSKKSV